MNSSSTNSPGRVLVLGATGRFGRHACHAFAGRGWTLHTLGRRAPAGLLAGRHEVGDVLDAATLARAAEGMDVIVHALNPAYGRWDAEVPRFAAAVLGAARTAGATVLLPGNVYGFGATMPEVLDARTSARPTNELGRVRVELEAAFRESGVPNIVLRAGDFVEGIATGAWFEDHLLKRIGAGRVVYPGPLDRAHAWAWLPDAALAAVLLAERRDALARFEDVPFPGWTLTGRELIDALSHATGRTLRPASFPWSVLRIAAPFSPMLRGVLSMRYLWERPHRLDGSRLGELLPGFVPTPLDAGLREALDRLGIVPPSAVSGASPIR